MNYRNGAASIALAAVMACAHSANAQQAQVPVAFDLPAQSLSASLRAIGRATGRQIIIAASSIEGRKAPALHGTYTADQAVMRVTAGADLAIQYRSDAILIAKDEASSGAQPSNEILVTGSRIRGTQSASPLIELTGDQIRQAGQTSLAQAILSLPQAFGGGLNAGVGIGVPEGNGFNLGSASTINLRGLGSDATLTLLDGHRLAFTVYTQSIDISAVPLLAVDRLEIVPDGSSALYGSDAVAGVANIRLKRDYSGAEMSARVGLATDGGDHQQQYDAIAGTTWTGGGIYATYEFERDTPIEASQRSYSATRSPGLTLLPGQKYHDVLVNGHQDITSNLSFSLEGLYNWRTTHQAIAFSSSGNYLDFGELSSAKSTSFAVVPTLSLSLGADWTVGLSGSYGKDDARYRAPIYSGGVIVSPTVGCYCNTAATAELNADGNLLRLPAGMLKVALGAGYRDNDFHAYRTEGALQDVRAHQRSYYGYVEINAPIISPEMGVPLLRKLDLSAAVRHERYPGVGEVTTPKFGIIASPNENLDIKASWGKSFKAPTLYERYSQQSSSIDYARNYGGAELPASATVIEMDGGNPDLKPERATSWSATLSLHPAVLPAARLEVTYFNVHYTNRVVTPIAFPPVALSDPAYADLINRSPSDADKAQAISGRTIFDYLTTPYDPANVVAIVDNQNRNAERQVIRGVDVLGSYRASLGHSSLTATINLSYLRSSQQLSDLQQFVALAGTLFNPPHFRGRAGLVWEAGQVSASSFVNYTGGVADTRSAPVVRIGSFTTWDLSARYDLPVESGLAKGLAFSIAVQNITNTRPDTIRTDVSYETPYDSTNNSPVGRFVSFTLTKKW